MYLFWELKNIPKGFENFEKFQSFPLVESLNIYHFLYDLPDELLNELTVIRIFGKLNPNQRKKYEEALVNFKADLSNYIDSEIFSDLQIMIPIGEYFFDEKKKNKIEKLIADLDIETNKNIAQYSSDNQDDDFLLFYNNLSEVSRNSLNVNFGKVIIRLQKTHESKNELRLIDKSVLINVNNGVKKLKENINKKISNYEHLRNYRPPTFLENFKNSFNNSITQLIRNEKRRIFFYGSDVFISKKSSKDLVGENPISHYDLKNGYPTITDIGSSLLILNLETTQNHNLHQLSSQLKRKNENDYIILEGSDLSIERYFQEYEKVDLPTEDEVKKKFTGILIALLRERRRYDRTVNDAFLHNLIENNSLKDFFGDTIDLDALNQTIKTMDKISYKDLTSNDEFWITFISKYKSLINDSPYALMKDKLNIEITDEYRRITFNNYEANFKMNSISLHYLAALIELFKKTNKKVHVIDIKEAVYKHIGETENPNASIIDKNKNASDAVRKSLKGIKDKKGLNIIFEKYIKFENYSYYLTHANEIDITITGFSL